MKLILLPLFFFFVLTPFAVFAQPPEERPSNSQLQRQVQEDAQLERLKDTVYRFLDNSVNRLESFIERALLTGNVTEEQALEMAEILEEYKTFVNDSKISLDETESITELRTLANNIRSSQNFGQVVSKVNQVRKESYYLNLENTTNRFQGLIEKVEAHIEGAKTVDHDTLAAESLLAEAKRKLALADEVISTRGQGPRLVPGVLIREAGEDLRNALKILRDLYTEESWTLEE